VINGDNASELIDRITGSPPLPQPNCPGKLRQRQSTDKPSPDTDPSRLPFLRVRRLPTSTRCVHDNGVHGLRMSGNEERRRRLALESDSDLTPTSPRGEGLERLSLRRHRAKTKCEHPQCCSRCACHRYLGSQCCIWSAAGCSSRSVDVAGPRLRPTGPRGTDSISRAQTTSLLQPTG